MEWGEEQKRPLLCASTAHQYENISMLSALFKAQIQNTAEHFTPMKKINSAPTRPSTELHKLCCLFLPSSVVIYVDQDTHTEFCLNKFLVEDLGSNSFFEHLKHEVFPSYNFLSQQKG